MSAPKLIAAATRSTGCPAAALGLLERRAHGRVHVRAGVAVGDREDVEGVDLVDVGLEVRDGGPEGGEQAGPVTGPADHQATSVPLSARSRVRICGRVLARRPPAARRPAGRAARRRGSRAGGPRGRATAGPRSGPPNRPGGPPRRPARRARPRGRARRRGRRRRGRRPRDGRGPTRASSRASGPPAKPVTPYEPRVAARTMSVIARRVTSDRPGVCLAGTRATSSSQAGRAATGGSVGGRVVSYRLRPGRSRLGPCQTTPPEDHAWPAPARSAARPRWAGFNPQSVGMNRVRAHRRMQPNLQPLVIDNQQGRPDQVARLHPLPTDAVEGLPLGRPAPVAAPTLTGPTGRHPTTGRLRPDG